MPLELDMGYFQDTGLLILYSLFFLLYAEWDISMVFGFLCAVILSSSCYVLEAGRFRLAAVFCFLAVSLFCPSCFCFFPVVFYIFYRDCSYLAFIILCPAYFYHFISEEKSFSVPVFLESFGFLLAFLLYQGTKRYERLSNIFRKIQDDNRENQLLLSEKNKMLLEKQDFEIYTATLRERNRIAREIHDNVGHVLSRSILLVGAGKALNQNQDLVPVLNHLDLSLNTAMDSIRISVHDLHDESIHLKEAIESLIQDFTFCPVEFHYDMSYEISKELKYCFISITKEALTNIIKHSNASQVQIRIQEHPALYQLCITDNGQVYDHLSSHSDCSGKWKAYQHPDGYHHCDSPGIGLINMRDRVRALNGTLQLQADNGFQIFVAIPKLQESKVI